MVRSLGAGKATCQVLCAPPPRSAQQPALVFTGAPLEVNQTPPTRWMLVSRQGSHYYFLDASFRPVIIPLSLFRQSPFSWIPRSRPTLWRGLPGSLQAVLKNSCEGGFFICLAIPTLLLFFPSLWLHSFSCSLWRGLSRRRAIPVWGRVRSLITPRASTTRPLAAMHFFSTPPVAKTPLPDSMPFLATPLANSTRPMEPLRSLATPMATTTPLNGAFSLVHNTSGNYNTAIGLNALYSNTTGSQN